MVDGSTLRILLFATLVAAPASLAQHSPPPSPAGESERDPSLGEAIAVPMPQLSRRQQKRYETPELPDTKSANGPQLIDGELPQPLIDYYARTGTIIQRISLFSNGVVALALEGAGANIRKRVIIPAGAIDNYATAVSRSAIDSISLESIRPPDASNLSFIRVTNDGGYSERRFHTSSILPMELQRQKGILEDLLRVLAEDREVTSPLKDYEPRIGDRLISDDAKTYEVTRLMATPDDGMIVELSCTREPVKMFIAAKDLYNYFVATKARSAE